MDKFDFKELIKMHRKIERKMSDIKNKATVLALISNPPYPNGTSCRAEAHRKKKKLFFCFKPHVLL